MPIYEYVVLDKDGQPSELIVELFQKMADEPLSVHPTTGQRIQRIISRPNIVVDASQPKTIGELAHKNTEEKVSRGELSKTALDYESGKSKRKKALNKVKKLGTMTSKQKTRYIMEGKE